MYAYAAIATVILATGLSTGTSQYAFGLFVEPLEATFGWSRTEISASLSFSAVGGLAAPFIGRAMDRYGARPILAVSLVIMGLGFALRPLMSDLWHWYALSFAQFVAVSGATVLPTGKLVAVWFPRSRGRAMAVAAMGNNFGGLAMPPLVVAALAYGGWAQAFTWVGAIAFAIAILALLVVREGPEETAATTTARVAPPAAPETLTTRSLARSRTFWTLATTITLGSFTYSAILPHVLAHLTTSDLPVARATFMLGTLAIGGICGKLVFGMLADRVGARVAIITNLVGQAIFATLVALVDSPAAFTLAVPAFGMFMGGFGVLNMLLVQDCFGVRQYGTVMGLLNLGVVVSFGLGPLIAGGSFDLTGSYAAGFCITAGLFLVAAIVLGASPATPGVGPDRNASRRAGS